MSCHSCGHDVELFLDLGQSPIADAYTSTPDEASPTFPLQVGSCVGCRLVQLLEAPPGDVLFGPDYSFYSSASPQLVTYHEAYAAGVRSRYPNQVALGVLEIGSNDGDLLQHFADVPHLGVDPSTGPAGAARVRGLTVLDEPFTSALADHIDQRFGVIVANHVLAHVDDLGDVLAGVRRLLHPDGVAVIEVQYLPDLLVNNAFDFVYHEHRNFFSLTTLASAAIRHGLYLVDAEVTDRQHGSLRATFRPAGSTGTSRVGELLDSEHWIPDGLRGMQGRAERIRTRLQDLVASQSGVTAVYGAPAKTTTLLNFCGFTSKDLAFCTDLTPAKWGRHIPGTGIPIQPPGELPDTYLLGVWNYAGSVMRNNPGPRWIMPLPAPMVL